MRIYIDQETDQVIIQPGINQAVSQIEYKRSPYATLEVQFTRQGVVQELANDATGVFEIKEQGHYDENPVVQALAWVKTGTGTDTVYTFIFSLVNSTLDTLFDVDPPGDTDVDPAQITFMGEMQWAVGGQIHKTPTLTVLIDNDVVREGDVGPSTPALMYGIFMPSITRLTGGTPTDLDYLPTVPLITGTILELLIDDGFGNLQWLPQVLEAGIAAGPGVTTPLDYNGSTNDRRWKTGTALTGAAGADGGIKYDYSTDTANTDPTAGYFKFDNTTLASITAFLISNTDADARGLSALLATWDSSTTLTHRGYVLIHKDGSPGNYVMFEINAARTDNTGWQSFPVTYIASGGTLAINDVCRMFFFRTGDKGGAGTNGANGRDAGLKYTYSTDTTNTDPTSGKLKFDTTSLGSITALRISNTDGDSNALATLLNQLDASSASVRSTVIIYKDGSPGNILVFTVTGARTDNTGWKSFPVTFVASSGSFANNDILKFQFVPEPASPASGLDGRQAIFSKASQSIPNTTWTEITYSTPTGELVTDSYVAAGSTAGRLKFLEPGIYHVLFSGLGYDDNSGGTVRAVTMQISLVGGPGENWTIPTQAYSPALHDILNDNYGVFSIEALVRVSAADVTAEAGSPGTRDIQVTTYHDKGGAWTINQCKLVVTRLGDMPA